MTRSLAIVGASLAGLRGAEAVRKAGFDGTITLIGKEDHLPYDRPPLSKAVLDAAMIEPADTTFRSTAALRDDLGIDVVLGTEVHGLDSKRRVLSIADGDLPYDALVIATGSTPRTIDDCGLTGIHTFRTIEDARTVRDGLDARVRIVVVGAGFIGSEIASAARKRGLDVTVLEMQPVPLVRAIGIEMGSVLGNLHLQHGVDLRCGVKIDKLIGDENGHVKSVELSDGTNVPTELVVVAVGAAPATDWLTGSGVATDDGVTCDATLASTVGDVYAAGDVARWNNPVFGESMRVEHWTNAAEQGAVAALNAVGVGKALVYAEVPYFWSDLHGTRVQFVGSSAADEVRVVFEQGEVGKLVALYRRDDRLVGALALNTSSHIMKYRAAIAAKASWTQAVSISDTLRSRGQAKR